MPRMRAQKSSLIAAVLFGAAPLVYATVGLGAADDSRVFWMAAIATLFMGGLISASIGRRRGRRAVFLQAALTFGVSTFMAVLTAFMMGSTAWTEIFAMSAAFGLSLAVATLCVAWARTTP